MSTSTLITETGIAIFHNGSHATVGSDHPNFERIKAALKNKDYEEVFTLTDLRQTVKRFLTPDKAFTLENDLIVFEEIAFTKVITDKVLRMIDAGNEGAPLYAFLRNVRQNPSKAAQEELLLFCIANGFMITEDGFILAYKKVRGDYTDTYTGRVDNHVGQKPSMKREAVDPNRHNTCSHGYHFAAYTYAKAFGGEHLMLIKVNPADVVAVPIDYNNEKGRCWTYEVIGEIEDQQPLPRHEVYSSLGEVPVKVLETVQAAKDTVTKKISIAEASRDTLARRIADIESLGGEAVALRTECNELAVQISDLYAQLDDLTVEESCDENCLGCENCEIETCDDCGNHVEDCDCCGYCGVSGCEGDCQYDCSNCYDGGCDDCADRCMTCHGLEGFTCKCDEGIDKA